jgi:hypothetical protein
MIKRFVAALAVAQLCVLALPSGPVLADGNTNGEYHFTDTRAFAGFTQTTDFAQVGVDVDRGVHFFQSKNPGGAAIRVAGTILRLDISAEDLFASGCYLIPDSGFSVSKDLEWARLQTQVPAQSNCPGNLLDGGYSAGDLPFDLSIDVTWTYKGSVGALSQGSNYSCSTVRRDQSTKYDVSYSSAQGTFSPFTSGTLVTDYSYFQSGRVDALQMGSLSDLCTGFSSGGEFGPSGESHLGGTFAAASLSDEQGNQAFVSVFTGYSRYQDRQPLGAPDSQKINLVQVYLAQEDGSWLYGCSLLPDGAFTMDSRLGSAQLSMLLPVESNCPEGEGSLTGPISVNVQWQGSGVLATVRSTTHFACAQFLSQYQQTALFEMASTSGTITGLGSLASAPNADILATSSTTQAVTGDQSPGCSPS